MRQMKRLFLALLLILHPSLAFAGNSANYENLVQFAYANVASATTDQTFTYTATGSALGTTSGKKIRVLNYTAIAGGTATTVVFNSKGGGAGTAISSTK